MLGTLGTTLHLMKLIHESPNEISNCEVEMVCNCKSEIGGLAGIYISRSMLQYWIKFMN